MDRRKHKYRCLCSASLDSFSFNLFYMLTSNKLFLKIDSSKQISETIELHLLASFTMLLSNLAGTKIA
jgi:hypothetical protein